MRSTNRQLLKISFRRAEMTAFWIVLTAVLWLTLGLASAALGVHQPWIWGAGALGVLVPGLVWSSWFEWGIRAWNKGTTLLTAALRRYVLLVDYYLLFGAVSRAGSSLDKTPGGDVSGWTPRQHAELDASAPSTYHGWQASLFPATVLLMLLGDEQQDNTPSHSSYTLY